MHIVLVSSRSFGRYIQVGDELLSEAGLQIRRLSSEEWPLDEPRLIQIAARETPDAIICGVEPITSNVLRAAKGLRIVMKHGVGIDNIDLHAATSLGIAVANTPGTNHTTVAEFTIAIMLTLLRDLCEANRSTKAGFWNRYVGFELGGKTVGVIGTGKIGSEVIRRLRGFGVTILAYDIIQNEGLASTYDVHYTSLQELLEESDLVTLHVPLTGQTKEMIGTEELGRMKASAFFINAARGELVDEQALCRHLKERRIAGAALDVFASEPPRANPLLQLDNVLVTPHMGAYTHEALERMDRICAQTVVRVLRGEACPNVLNPTVMESFGP